MRLALSLSWVELPSRDAAARVEAEAIRALTPLFNGGRTRGAIWDPAQENLGGRRSRGAVRPLDRTRVALLGSDRRRPDDHRGRGPRLGGGERQRLAPGGVRHDEPPPPPALVVSCRALSSPRADVGRPHEWYSTVWRQLYGDPPGWEQVVDDMTERERTALRSPRSRACSPRGCSGGRALGARTDSTVTKGRSSATPENAGARISETLRRPSAATWSSTGTRFQAEPMVRAGRPSGVGTEVGINGAAARRALPSGS